MTESFLSEREQGLVQLQYFLEDVVTIDDHQILKRFSRDEIISLLEGLGREG